MKAKQKIRAGAVAAILILTPSFAGCDFERERRLPPSGLFGFLAQVSTGATIVVGQYCGQTAPFPGNAGGYAAIRTLCTTACGSSTAHLCTPAELQTGVQFGITVPAASWYGTFEQSVTPGTLTGHDCTGWTNSAATSTGPLVQVAPFAPTRDTCDNSYPFACCDYRVLSP